MNRWYYLAVWICGAIAVFATVQMGLAGTLLGVAVSLYLFLVLSAFTLIVVDSVVASRQRCYYDMTGSIDYSHVSIVGVNPDGSYNISVGYRMERK